MHAYMMMGVPSLPLPFTAAAFGEERRRQPYPRRPFEGSLRIEMAIRVLVLGLLGLG